MPYFLNCSFKSSEFELMMREKYFVDKTRMISKINEIVGKKDRYVCITRPRRFGKTVNAMMLACYYTQNSDFKDLFDNLEIASDPSYLEHLNKYNVIYLTLNEVPKPNCTYEEFINNYIFDLVDELDKSFPDAEVDRSRPLPKIFDKIHEKYQQGFIFILDEWDYIFNNNLFSESDRENFLQFLKDLLKDKPYVELAYMTGVLPIAKYSSGSALNMFIEFNMINDYMFDDCFGFTESEVEVLCAKQTRIQMSELK